MVSQIHFLIPAIMLIWEEYGNYMYSIFSKKIYTVFIRVIAGLAILILIFSILNNLFIYKSVNENNLLHLVFLITGDVIAIIPCILIVLKPKYDYLISIVAFFILYLFLFFSQIMRWE